MLEDDSFYATARLLGYRAEEAKSIGGSWVIPPDCSSYDYPQCIFIRGTLATIPQILSHEKVRLDVWIKYGIG